MKGMMNLLERAGLVQREDEAPMPDAVPQASVGAPPVPASSLPSWLDMDEPIRRQVIAAMDAADDTWTIADPLHDASLKIAAIEAHAANLRAGLSVAEQETHAAVTGVQQRQESSASEIRRQISDLEGLLARELARGAQETAALEAAFQSKKESAQRELEQLARSAGEFQTLVAQFKSAGSV